MAGILLVSSRKLPKEILKLSSECGQLSTFRARIHLLSKEKCASRAIAGTSSSSKLRNHSIDSLQKSQLRNFRFSSVLYQDSQIVKTPPFADSVSEGDIRWEKAVGDQVAEDDVVAEIETDKTSMPVPAPCNGIIEERLVEDGATVKAGQALFKIKPTAGGPPPKKKEEKTSAASAPPPPPPPPQVSAAPPVEAPVSRPAEPLVSRPSAPSPPSNIPVAAIRHAQAIEAATVKLPPADPTSEISGTRSEQRVKMNRMRQRIAQRLKEAQNVNAMLTTFNEIDMSAIIEFRKTHLEAFQKKHGLKLGFMSPFIKASAYALQDQPVVNAVIDGTEIVYRDYIDISVAVATPKGLVVPVLRNVEAMNFADIEKSIAALGEKARSGALAVEDMDGGTFTISNGGVFGSLMGTPIINPPQAAILGMHGTFERPVAIKGQVVVRPMMYVALTYDHRLIDGREAVLFLRKIKAAVEDPRIILAGL